jgi:dihydroxy-acid dehydratase
LSVKDRRLEVLLSDSELDGRRQQPKAPRATPTRGYAKLYAESVLGAELGCDFNFLRDGG